MTVAWRAQGTVGIGSTSVTPGLPASLATGEGILIMVVTKPDTATINTPTDWTPVADIAGGGGSNGNGTGPTRQAWFWRVKDAGWSTMPAVSVTSGNSSAAIASVYTKDGAAGWIAPASATTTFGSGAATTDGAATLGSDPGFTAGDLAVVGYSTQDEAPTWSAQAITATGVSAWGTATEQSEAVETTTGLDIGGMYFTRSVTTGTSSAAPATAATLSIAGRGTVAGIRLREIVLAAGADAGSIAAADVSALTASALATDTASLAVADVSALLALASAVESNSLAADDASALAITTSLAATDTASLAVADTSAVEATFVALAATDTSSIAVADVSELAITAFKTASDTRSLRAVEVGRDLYTGIDNRYPDPSFEEGVITSGTVTNATVERVTGQNAWDGDAHVLITSVVDGGATGVPFQAVPALPNTAYVVAARIRSRSGAATSWRVNLVFLDSVGNIAYIDNSIFTLTTNWQTYELGAGGVATAAYVVVMISRQGSVGVDAEVEVDGLQVNPAATLQAYDPYSAITSRYGTDTASIAVADASDLVAFVALAVTDAASIAVADASALEVTAHKTASESRSLAAWEGQDLKFGSISNRLADPSFETAIGTVQLTNATAVRVTGQNAWDGDAHALVTTTAAGGASIARFGLVPALPSTAYNTQIRLRSRSGDVSVAFSTLQVRSDGFEVANSVSFETLTASWQTFTRDLTLQPTTAYLRVGITRGSGADSEIEVDGIQIAPGSAPIAFDPYSAITSRYGTDTGSLAVTESADVVDLAASDPIAGTDAGSVAIAETVTVMALLAGTDTGSVAAADASTSLSLLDRTDTGSLAIADAMDLLSLLAVTDGGSLAAADTADAALLVTDFIGWGVPI